MYPMSTVEPTYRMILMVVKTLLEQKVAPDAILATVKTMEDTINEGEEMRRGLESTWAQVKPFFLRNDELGIDHQP
jgi:hypothetical protein